MKFVEFDTKFLVAPVGATPPPPKELFAKNADTFSIATEPPFPEPLLLEGFTTATLV